MKTRPGFTLTEILIVLAVVAMLASLTLAIFSRVRENGRRTSCQGNLRQLVLATQQYVQDANGRYPSPASPGLYRSYFGIAPACPSFDRVKAQVSPDISSYRLWEGLNKVNFKTQTITGLLESEIPHPSVTPMWRELSTFSQDISASCILGPSPMPIPHFGGANNAYCDGHIKWASAAQALEEFCAHAQDTPSSQEH